MFVMKTVKNITIPFHRLNSYQICLHSDIFAKYNNRSQTSKAQAHNSLWTYLIFKMENLFVVIFSVYASTCIVMYYNSIFLKSNQNVWNFTRKSRTFYIIHLQKGTYKKEHKNLTRFMSSKIRNLFSSWRLKLSCK